MITAAEPRARDIDIDSDRLSGFEEFYLALSSPISSNSNKSSNEDVVIIEEPELPKRAPVRQGNSSRVEKKTTSPSDEGEAQKKFGSAKAISSDQYFGNSAGDDSVSFSHTT